MSCGHCQRGQAAGSCVEGYVSYLSGDYPCPFNKDPAAAPKNLRELPRLKGRFAGAPVVVLHPSQVERLGAIADAEYGGFIVSQPIPTGTIPDDGAPEVRNSPEREIAKDDDLWTVAPEAVATDDDLWTVEPE